MQINLELTDDEIVSVLKQRIPDSNEPAIDFSGIDIYIPEQEEIAIKLQEEYDSVIVAATMFYGMRVSYEVKEKKDKYFFITKFTFGGYSVDKYRFIFETDRNLILQTVNYEKRDHRNNNLYLDSSGNLEKTLEGLANDIKDPGFFTPIEEFRRKVLKIKERTPRDPNSRNVKLLNRNFKVPKDEYEDWQKIVDNFITAGKKVGAHFYTRQRENKSDDTITLTISTGYSSNFKDLPWYHYQVSNLYGTSNHKRAVSRDIILELGKHRHFISSKVEISEFHGNEKEKQNVNALDFKEQLQWLIDNAL